jgi:hypothetical protein
MPKQPREVPTAIKDASNQIFNLLKYECFPELTKLQLTNTELVRAFTLALNRFREPIKGGSVNGRKRFVQQKYEKQYQSLEERLKMAHELHNASKEKSEPNLKKRS